MKGYKEKQTKEQQLLTEAKLRIRELWERYPTVDEENEAWHLLRLASKNA